MVFLFILSLAVIPLPAVCQDIPDADKLIDFYRLAGRSYDTLKQTGTDFLGKKITANEYRTVLSAWKWKNEKNDSLAPCPKNNWKAHYTKLTPLHYRLCYAWAELKGLHSALSANDEEMFQYHESEFRKFMQEALDIFEHPGQNKPTDLSELLE